MSKIFTIIFHPVIYVGLAFSYYYEFLSLSPDSELVKQSSPEDILYWPLMAMPLNLLFFLIVTAIFLFKKIDGSHYLIYCVIIVCLICIDYFLYQELKYTVLGR